MSADEMMPAPDVYRMAFEDWVSNSPYERSLSRYPNNEEVSAWPGQYQDITVQIAWEAWQEAIKTMSKKIPLPEALSVLAAVSPDEGLSRFMDYFRKEGWITGYMKCSVCNESSLTAGEDDGKPPVELCPHCGGECSWEIICRAPKRT